MNIFTKLTISIVFLCMMQIVFAQQLTHADYQKIDVPFYNRDAVRTALLKQQPSDTIWLPAAVNYFWNDIPSSHYIYEYHEDGFLKKMTMYSAYNGDIEASDDYNNIYRDPLRDIPDTIFTGGYTHPDTGEYYPPIRFYYNHREADSSYWEEYYQEWDGEKWKPAQKAVYVHLLDTLSASELQDHVEYYDVYGNIAEGWKAFFTFDEQGNVTESLVDVYNTSTHQYKPGAKRIYSYDNEGKCHTIDYYLFTSGTWKLESRFTDMKWFEFHGIDNGDMLLFGRVVGLYTDYPLKNKNKLSSLKYWELNAGTLDLTWIDTIKWKNEPYSCHYDHYSNVGCIVARWYITYNERLHITSRGSLTYNEFYILPCNPDPEPPFYILDDYINKYDDRQRRYEYVHNQTAYPPSSFAEDPTVAEHLTMTYVIDSFTYVIRPPVGIDELPLAQSELQIIPNPSNDTVCIKAADDIATITLYAADGRLAHSQAGSGREAMVNLQGVAKGVYVVQVRLKNGGVQTGKVVRN